MKSKRKVSAKSKGIRVSEKTLAKRSITSQRQHEFLNKIHVKDCIAFMKELPDSCL